MDQSGFWTTSANICPCSPAHDIIIQIGALADITDVQLQFGGSNHPKRIRVWASMDGFTFANQEEVSWLRKGNDIINMNESKQQ